MKNEISAVRTLMEASGQAPGEVTANLYYMLIQEERKELEAAYTARDEVEEFDACLDLIWVTIGYMLARGWPIMEGWKEVERSNLDKIDPETLQVIKRSDGKVMKPEGWTPPNLRAILGYDFGNPTPMWILKSQTYRSE